MRIIIEINCDNTAFEPVPNNEIIRILRDLQYLVSRNDLEEGDKHSIRDINGNRVGYLKVTDN